MMADGPTMEAPFVPTEIDEAKDVELNVILPSDAKKSLDFLRSSLIQNENQALEAGSTSLNHDAHIGFQGGINLMEEVNQNELSFGTHFGMHVNQEQMGGQARLQPGNLFQVQYEQHPIETPRMPWLYHQIYQVPVSSIFYKYINSDFSFQLFLRETWSLADIER
ncbi:hypothetical protein KSP40_PGU016753 [Platanthera guangdongensis]|uniref:Uncharacterized protein n=1 Tax=Platanthera guangdongensis TaxID=2320717 RepID=A0ABR2MBK6_9ASPA